MRYLFAALAVAGAVFSTAVQAETRIFIISNNADGYGVDRCLATGAIPANAGGCKAGSCEQFVAIECSR